MPDDGAVGLGLHLRDGAIPFALTKLGARSLEELVEVLPELVERYTRIPSEQRARTIEADGRSLDATLVEGLKAVETELARASESLAASDRDAVRIQGKFLEARYKDDGGPVA
jgi:hypothetical protein